jgi:hypothetical protein
LIPNDLSIVVKSLRLAQKSHFITLEAYTVSKTPTPNSTQSIKETKTKIESTISCGKPNMAAPEQILMAHGSDSFLNPFLDPFLDCSLPDMSLDFQGNNWNQFEYEWRVLMSSNAYDQAMLWNSIPTENLNTEYLPRSQPIMSCPDPITGFEDFIDDVFCLPPESTQLTPLSSPNNSYSQASSFTSDFQQDSISLSYTMSSTSPSAPPEALYTCDTCARKFEKKSILKFVFYFLHKLNPPPMFLTFNPRRHKKQHEKPFQCHLCDNRFAENRDMRRHIVVHHSSQTPGLSQPRYLCSEQGCRFAQTGFGRKDHLTRHMRRAHSRLAP